MYYPANALYVCRVRCITYYKVCWLDNTLINQLRILQANVPNIYYKKKKERHTHSQISV